MQVEVVEEVMDMVWEVINMVGREADKVVKEVAKSPSFSSWSLPSLRILQVLEGLFYTIGQFTIDTIE